MTVCCIWFSSDWRYITV